MPAPSYTKYPTATQQKMVPPPAYNKVKKQTEKLVFSAAPLILFIMDTYRLLLQLRNNYQLVKYFLSLLPFLLISSILP